MKKYVLTGGPACGKTTLIEEFRRRSHFVIDETARLVLQERKHIPTSPEEWLVRQKMITEKQLDFESKLTENESCSCVFLDRGLPDIAAYSRHLLGYFPEELIKCNLNDRYDLVFCLDLLPFEADGLRIEKDDEEARIIHGRIIKAYRECGYNVISVPLLDGVNLKEKIRKRADFILGMINDLKGGCE
jgi:predicted ATPase